MHYSVLNRNTQPRHRVTQMRSECALFAERQCKIRTLSTHRTEQHAQVRLRGTRIYAYGHRTANAFRLNVCTNIYLQHI